MIIVAILFFYSLIGVVSMTIIDESTDYDDKKLTAVFLFWPLFLVFFYFKTYF